MFFSEKKMAENHIGFNVVSPALWYAQEAKWFLRIQQRNPAASPKLLQSYCSPHGSEQSMAGTVAWSIWE